MEITEKSFESITLLTIVELEYSTVTKVVQCSGIIIIILSECQCQQDEFLTTYQSEWTASFGVEPVGALSHRQSAWDNPGIAVMRSQLESGLVDACQKLRFWLLLLPTLVTGYPLLQLQRVACAWTTKQFVWP